MLEEQFFYTFSGLFLLGLAPEISPRHSVPKPGGLFSKRKSPKLYVASLRWLPGCLHLSGARRDTTGIARFVKPECSRIYFSKGEDLRHTQHQVNKMMFFLYIPFLS